MNQIEKNITELLPKGFALRPNRKFYEIIHIGQKRFWQLYRDEKSPTIEELKSISDYFKIPLQNFIPIHYNLKVDQKATPKRY